MADPGGFYGGYLTMSQGMGENIDRMARLKSFIQQREAALPMEQEIAANAPALVKGRLEGTPFENRKLSQEMALQGLLANRAYMTLAEQMRSNAAREKQAQDMLAETTRYHNIEGQKYDQINVLNRGLASKGLTAQRDAAGNVSLVPLPGANSNKPLPQSAEKSLTSGADSLNQLSAVANSFKPEYLANLGGITGTPGIYSEGVRAYSKYGPGMSPDMANWWDSYRNIVENPARHSIFGGALSGRESNLWNRAQIDPGIKDPAQVISAIDQRLGLAAVALARQAKSSSTQYSPEQIKSILGDMPLDQIPREVSDLKQAQTIGAMIRGKGMASAAQTAPPTATGPNGEKIMWDGKAWIPQQ